MPAPYGVTATGFNTKTLEEITADFEAAARVEFGANVDLDPKTSALGQLVRIMADRLADAWQLGQGTYAAAFPDTASGVPLVLNAALTGTVAITPTFTSVTIRMTGTPGTIVPIGSRFSIPNVPVAVFTNAGIPYTIGGGGFVDGSFNCVNYGPITALAGTVTQIDTPVAGLASVTNPADQGQLGTLAESDPALRLRREQTIRAQGASAFEAVRAHVLEVPGVVDCFVFENETDAIVDTIPPHAFEVVVRGGTDAAVAAVIFAQKPLAIKAHGTTTVAVSDSQGNAHAIGLTRPTTLNAYVKLSVFTLAGAPTNIADLIEAAVAAWGDLNLRTGSPLLSSMFFPAIYAVSPKIHAVVLGELQPLVDVVYPPVEIVILPTRRQVIDLDTARIEVTVIPDNGSFS